MHKIKKVFIVFCEQNSLKPLIFRYKRCAQKYTQGNKTYEIKQFIHGSAKSQQFYHQKEVSYRFSQQKQKQLEIAKQARQIKKLQQPKDLLQQIANYNIKQVEKYSKIPIKGTIIPSQQYYGFFDGSHHTKTGKAGIGCFISDAEGKVLLSRSQSVGHQTNNYAEYSALVYLLLDALTHNIRKFKVFGDSELVVKGIKGEYKIKAQNIRNHMVLGRQLTNKFQQFQISHLKRELNKRADELSRLGRQK